MWKKLSVSLEGEEFQRFEPAVGNDILNNYKCMWFGSIEKVIGAWSKLFMGTMLLGGNGIGHIMTLVNCVSDMDLWAVTIQSYTIKLLSTINIFQDMIQIFKDGVRHFISFYEYIRGLTIQCNSVILLTNYMYNTNKQTH